MKIRAIGLTGWLTTLVIFVWTIVESIVVVVYIYVCGCVSGEVLRPSSTANPADICVPSEGTSLQYDILGWDHPNSYSHCLNFL